MVQSLDELGKETAAALSGAVLGQSLALGELMLEIDPERIVAGRQGAFWVE